MLNNRIILKGNLTKDPEYKTFSDKDLVTFRIAVNESVGGGKEETIYVDIDGWGTHAAYANNVTLSKGDRVIVDGRLRQRNWEDKNGASRVSYSVLPSTFSKVVKPTRSDNQSFNKFQNIDGESSMSDLVDTSSEKVESF